MSSSQGDPSAPAPSPSELQQAEVQEPWQPTPEQQQLIADSEVLKAEGNALYASGDYDRAIDKYAAAIEVAPERAPQRAVYWANIAACHVNLERHKEAIRCCSDALEVDPAYVKALARRSVCYEATDEPERALADAKRVGRCAARGSTPEGGPGSGAVLALACRSGCHLGSGCSRPASPSTPLFFQ
jgi:tetratricopeptide (TPR) repeat protein